jgi:hypothetical protein
MSPHEPLPGPFPGAESARTAGGWGIVSVHAALPEMSPAPHRSADLGRRIRFVLDTAILVALICWLHPS